LTTAGVASIIWRPLTAGKADEHLFQSCLAYGVIFHGKLIANFFHGGKESSKTDRWGAWDVILYKAMVDILQ